MCIVGADKEKCDRDTKQKLLGGRILRPIVDLLPHVEVIECTTVEVKGNTSDMVEHDIRAKHVGHVGKGPRGLLRDTGNGVEYDLGTENQDKVDGPGTCKRRISCQRVTLRDRGISAGAQRRGAKYTFSVCPVGIKIRQRSLVTDLLQSLRRLMVDLENTTRPPPSGSGRSFCVSLGHVEINAAPARRLVRRVVGDGALE
jgi:hypothetical protein